MLVHHKQGIRKQLKIMFGYKLLTMFGYTVTLTSTRKLLLDIPHVPKLEHTYVLHTQLGRYQNLNIHCMVCFLQIKESKVSILLQNAISSCYKQIYCVNQLRMTKQAYNLSLDHYHDRVENCSRISNK